MSNRDALLDGALRLFAQRGYEAVGVQEVCTAAGVTKPTLYHYFGSKQGLLEALLEQRYAPATAELTRLAEYAGDLPATLERVVRHLFRSAEDDPTLARLALALWFTSPGGEAAGAFAPHRAARRRILEDLFARAAADHGNMWGRQEAYAVSLLGVAHAHVGLALDGELLLDEVAARRVTQQFSHGIYS